MSQIGSNNPDTGESNSGIGRHWQALTGKSGPTRPQLPRGFEWLGPIMEQVGTGAAGNINYDTGASRIAEGIDTGAVGNTFSNSLGSLNEGMKTGYLPDLNQLDAILRPGLERGFQTGAADLREQNALTGNLSGSGASQQITDYRAQLENQLGSNVAGIYGNALPAAIGARSGATAFGAGLPGQLETSLYGPLQQFPLQALGAATGGAGGAPLFANQGSSGNGAVGGVLSSYLTKGA